MVTGGGGARFLVKSDLWRILKWDLLGGICTVTAPAFRNVLWERACLGPSPKEDQLTRTAVPPCVLVEGR